MIGFLYKDYNCAKIKWIVTAMVLVLTLVAGIGGVVPKDRLQDVSVAVIIWLFALIFMLYIIVVSLVAKSVLETDQGNNNEAYMNSLPGGRKYYVIEKYIMIFLVFVLVMAVSAASLWIVMHYAGEPGIEKTVKKFLPYLPVITTVFVLVEAMELPFCFRFGPGMGTGIKTAIVLILFYSGAIYLMFGDLSVFDGFQFENIMEWFEKIKNGKIWIPVIGMAVYTISGMLSCRLYRQKPVN